MKKKVYESKCYAEQIAYDESERLGKLGKLMERPSCDDNGNYNSVKCIPGKM